MEPEISLPCSEEPDAGPFPMPEVHTFPLHFTKIHSNIFFPFTPRSTDWLLTFRFSDQRFLCSSHLSHAYCMSRAFILLDLITLIIFCEAYKLRSSSLSSRLQPPATSSFLGPNVAFAPHSQTQSILSS
jgi:hypothetical protein